MSELIFYTNPMSRGRIARWMLEEVGQPYRTEVLDYGTTMKAAAYLTINPMGKVPAIVHDGQVVTECAAICAYLAEAFPDAGLAPRAEERADYYRWLFFAAGPIESAVMIKALGVDVPEERRRMVGYGSYDEVLDALERMLDGRSFVTGDRFTAADVYVGSQIRWGLAFGTLPARPAFTAYSDRLGERPALIRATEIDDAITPPQPAH
ncbi:MAG TPA: glutathione S-transferase family protein [Sphingobium sp.]|uniref:glutathione S-transferase family protein n=1 Tax=Sphingobium sp. TaxID=1912891 RepID=UPI002ED2A613